MIGGNGEPRRHRQGNGQTARCFIMSNMLREHTCTHPFPHKNGNGLRCCEGPLADTSTPAMCMVEATPRMSQR